jgi:segregation and condensation protein A
LQKFEGPLDLLLYLIRKEEMDIFDIKINEITSQYLEYIKLIKELDIEVASDFIAMAATLIHIKSRMLLPKYDEEGNVIEQEDPRKELVQKLIEYEKYKEAAKMLNERPLLGRDIFARGTREVLKVEDDSVELEENALFSLISAYRKAIKSFQKKIHKVSQKAQSIAARILEIKDHILVGKRVTMNELIFNMNEKRLQVLITFLSLLELGKMGFVALFQSENFGEIYIEGKKEIPVDVISRVEEFDGVHAAENAAQLMNQVAEYDAAMEMIEGDSIHSIGGEDISTDEEILNAEKEMGLEGDVV